MRKILLPALVSSLLTPLWSAQAATTVIVNSSAPVSNQIMPQLRATHGTLGTLLSTATQIGSAVTAGNDKIAAMIQQSNENMQHYATFAQQARNLEDARRTYTVPSSICSESASGQASQISRQASAKQGKLSGGGGITNQQVKEQIASPAAPDDDQFAAATIRGQFCTAEDVEAYGALCQGISDQPGGDRQVRSVLYGAGEEEKAPELTFSPAQTDAAMMYMKNSARKTAGRPLRKEEVNSDTGRQYLGQTTQFEAIISAAEQPQLAMIAASQPNEATKAVLAETLNAASSKAWFDQNGSEQAKRTGMMSLREFEAFEVQRRYANTDYLKDLQEMEGDNLLRESIRIQSLQNALLLSIKQQLQENAILAGQQLSIAATEHYQPRLNATLQHLTTGAARE